MLMPGRQYSIANTNYRYGFNGKENDNDIESGEQDYGMRSYDRRIGKFLSIDPFTKKYPWLTPYQFASNSPIKFIDIDGMEGGDPAFKNFDPKVVNQSADERAGDPTRASKIDQNGTGLCG